MHGIFDESLHHRHEFAGKEGDRGRSIADLGILGLGDVDEGLRCGVDDVEELEDCGSIVRNVSLKENVATINNDD